MLYLSCVSFGVNIFLLFRPTFGVKFCIITIDWFLLLSLLYLLCRTLTLLSLNVRRLTNFRKRRTVFTWCRKKNADIVFLQETRSKKETEVQWRNKWGAGLILSYGNSNSLGVAILFKKGIDCTIHSKIIYPQGRYIILKADITGHKYTLINISAPNKG